MLRDKKKPITIFLSILLAVVSVVLIWRYTREWSHYTPPVLEPVSSTHLPGTVIVPALDTPLVKPGNAVWCATFQVAWNRILDDVIGGPLKIANAQPVADRLNSSLVADNVLPPGDYFAVAGRLEDGIINSIQLEMAQKFPGIQLPDFSEAVGFITYGYLDTKVTFTTPFVDAKKPLKFVDTAGSIHSVIAFGLHEGTDWKLRNQQADQVKVLFSQPGSELGLYGINTEFALELTADQADQQVIVAVLPRAEQLQASLDDLASRIEKYAPEKHLVKLQDIDTLRIPNVVFNVNHEFTELQGLDKVIQNPGEFQNLYIGKAFQSIRFRLDKSGATVISEAHVIPCAVPRHFIVNRPFLIVMKRRSEDNPYFAAWIDNAELLQEWNKK